VSGINLNIPAPEIDTHQMGLKTQNGSDDFD
jgi:hypothetical protein